MLQIDIGLLSSNEHTLDAFQLVGWIDICTHIKGMDKYVIHSITSLAEEYIND